MIGSLDNPPVVIRVKRWVAPVQNLFRILFLVAMGAGGAWLLAAPPSISGLRNLWIFGLFFFLIGVSGIWRHVRWLSSPPRVTLSPDGVVHEYAKYVRKWRWNEISGFRKVRFRGTDWMGFDVANPVTPNALRDATGADYALLNSRVVNDDVEDIVTLFIQARERWKSGDAPTIVKTVPPAWPRRSLWSRLATARLSRRRYWFGLILPAAILIAAAIIAENSPDVPVAAIRCLSLIVIGLWSWAMLIARRLRDIGIAPFVAFPLVMMLVPIFVIPLALIHRADIGTVGGALGLVAIVVIPGIIPGSKGDNAFGPPPTGDRRT